MEYKIQVKVDSIQQGASLLYALRDKFPQTQVNITLEFSNPEVAEEIIKYQISQSQEQKEQPQQQILKQPTQRKPENSSRFQKSQKSSRKSYWNE